MSAGPKVKSYLSRRPRRGGGRAACTVDPVPLLSHGETHKTMHKSQLQTHEDARRHENPAAHILEGTVPGRASASPTRVTCKVQIFKMKHTRAPPLGDSDARDVSASARASLAGRDQRSNSRIRRILLDSSWRLSFLPLVTNRRGLRRTARRLRC